MERPTDRERLASLRRCISNIRQLIMQSREAIAESRDAMEEVDRIMAQPFERTTLEKTGTTHIMPAPSAKESSAQVLARPMRNTPPPTTEPIQSLSTRTSQGPALASNDLSPGTIDGRA